MKMEYVNVNGYLIPKLENGPITDNTIGKYGMMRARYLDEHRPMERDQMLLDGTLAQHLTDIDCEAHRQVESLTKVLATEAKINELKELKAAGVRRGDVEQLPELEKQLTTIKKRANTKK